MADLFTIVDNYGIKQTFSVIKGPAGTEAFNQAVANGFKDGMNMFNKNLAGMDNPFQKVGTVYYTVDSTFKPAQQFGGDWMLLEDTFILCGNSTYPINTVAQAKNKSNRKGEANVTLSVEELPAHTHWSNGARFSGSGWYSEYYVYAQDIGCTCNSTGGSAAHNNMPPYEIVYAWMKVA